uniref:Dual specificity protein kinase spla-like n=1 Tax=Tetraselmis sp. GSL018 TaxID=582737 RepID=A0A061RZ63_9CHLO
MTERENNYCGTSLPPRPNAGTGATSNKLHLDAQDWQTPIRVVRADDRGACETTCSSSHPPCCVSTVNSLSDIEALQLRLPENSNSGTEKASTSAQLRSHPFVSRRTDKSKKFRLRDISEDSILDNSGWKHVTWIPLSSLKSWEKVKRMILYYVAFSRAFSRLRDSHNSVSLEPALVKRLSKVGEGCFAACFRCAMVDALGAKQEFALKIMRPGATDRDVDDFIRERNLLKKLRHSRIVDFIAAGNMAAPGERFPEMYLAMEFMRGGTIRDVILKQMDSPHQRIYTKSDALRWLTDTAKGLNYLHTRSPCIIHRDIKPENIMLTSPDTRTSTAKITDFGLHCLVERRRGFADDIYELTGNTGSLMYMAPEVFRMEPYNEKVDVFSFGINFWELFNSSLMIARITNMGSHDEIYSYACGVSNGMRPLIPRSWPQSVAMLITDCWEPLPENRPSFREILERLEACREDVAAMDRALTNRHCCCFM